jgi:hypothetical protein
LLFDVWGLIEIVFVKDSRVGDFVQHAVEFSVKGFQVGFGRDFFYAQLLLHLGGDVSEDFFVDKSRQ